MAAVFRAVSWSLLLIAFCLTAILPNISVGLWAIVPIGLIGAWQFIRHVLIKWHTRKEIRRITGVR